MFNITLTEDFQAITELKQMDNFASQAISSFTSNSHQAWYSFWYGEVSPIIKIQILGNKAHDAFVKSTMGQAFIKSIDPSHVELGIPEGYEVIWDIDENGNKLGSGSLIYTAPIIEEEVEEIIEETPEF